MDYTRYIPDEDQQHAWRQLVCEEEAKRGSKAPVSKYAITDQHIGMTPPKGFQWFAIIGTRGVIEAVGPFKTADKATDFCISNSVDGAVVPIADAVLEHGNIIVNFVKPR